MIVVHHLNNSRSQRILWLLEELGLDYEIERYQRDPETMLAPPALKRVHPLGKSPAIVDGDTVVVESGAIVEYLTARENNRFVPAAGTPARLLYTRFLHYAEGSMMPPLLMKLVFDRVETGPVPFFVKPVARMIAQKVKGTFVLPQIALHLGYLEAELAQRPWFTGEEFTAADIQMSFPLEAAASRGGLDAKYPNLVDFLRRIHARPAYRRALEQGGEYAYAKVNM